MGISQDLRRLGRHTVLFGTRLLDVDPRMVRDRLAKWREGEVGVPLRRGDGLKNHMFACDKMATKELFSFFCV